MNSIYYYETKIGKIAIADNGKSITHMELANLINHENFIIEETLLIKRASNQLLEYLDGTRDFFDLPLEPKGTDFQKSVWSQLQQIPYGETRSYKDIAVSIGNPKASRAIGMANNKNPIMIIIPCHRIIGSNGKLVGYAGGLDVKQQLLALETLNKKIGS